MNAKDKDILELKQSIESYENLVNKIVNRMQKMKEMYKEKKKYYKNVILTLRRSYLRSTQSDLQLPSIRENNLEVESAVGGSVNEEASPRLQQPSLVQLLGSSDLDAYRSSNFTPTFDREYFDKLIYDINTDFLKD